MVDFPTLQDTKMAKTLYQKLFDAHVVYEAEGETPILYINRHLIHEVTSPASL